MDSYKVDVGGAHAVVLGNCAFEGAAKRNRPNLNIGDLVYGRITFADKDMDPEMECMNAHGKSDGFGPLQGGYVTKCSIAMAKSIANPDNQILKGVSEVGAFEIIPGMNGKVWIKSELIKIVTLLMAMIDHCDGLSSQSVPSYVSQMVRNYKKN